MIQAFTSTLRDAPNATLAELQGVLADKAQHYHDFRCRIDDLFVDESNGSLVSRGQGFKEYVFQPYALHQLCTKLGVPGTYVDKCPTNLAAENLNFWLYQHRDKEAMLRCDGDEVRAVLSAKYQPVAHTDLMRWVAGGVDQDTPIRFELTDKTLDVQFVGRHEHDAGGNDLLNNGLTLRNSEVGAACVELSAFIFRRVCLNGLILSGSVNNWKRRHIGNVEVTETVRAVIRDLSEQSRQSLSTFGGSQSITVGDIPGMFDRIANRYRLTDVQRKAIEASYQSEPGNSLYSVINAVTGAAHSPALDVDQRLDLQRVGGRMLELAKTGTRWID